MTSKQSPFSVEIGDKFTARKERGDSDNVFWGLKARGVGYSLVWPIRGCAAGRGMVFGLSVLNRVCDFVRV